MKIKVSIIGASGYTGGELVYYLLKHPYAEILHCTSNSFAGELISKAHPTLSISSNIKFEKCDVDKISKDSDLVFLCLPHARSAEMAKQFLEKKVKVIDLSADFRLKSKSLYEKWYGPHPCPELLKSAVYGLCELYRKEVKGANLVANPGCYATATILSAIPLIKKGILQKNSLVVDAKSGTSGAGKKLDTKYLFCEVNENFFAYALEGHRHWPEIQQVLGQNFTFVPHLLPVERGILVTLYAQLKKKLSRAALWSIYDQFYKGEPFVQVLPEGAFPQLRSVQKSNFCQIGVQVDSTGHKAIIVGVIDNLGKGASGQAVQNMNLMFHLNETCGLI